jgi:hypothetical protein
MSISATIDTENARTEISLSWSYSSVYINRVETATGTSTPVRNAEPAQLAGGVWEGYDYEAPLGTEFYYVASFGTDTISSPSYVIDNPLRYCWLKHLNSPERNMRIDLQEVPEVRRRSMTENIDVIGRSAPVAIGARRTTASGTMSLATYSIQEARNLMSLLEDGTVLLLQTPDDYLIGGNDYVSIGDVEHSRVGGKARNSIGSFTIPFQVVNRPSSTGTSLGGLRITWGTTEEQYLSWTQLLAPRAGFPTPSWQTVVYGNVAVPEGPA